MDENKFSPDQSSMEQIPLSTPETTGNQPLNGIPQTNTVLPETETTPKRNGVWLTLAIAGLCFALLLGGFALYAALENQEAFKVPQSNTPAYNYRDNVTEEDKLTSQEIIAKMTPSVVTFEVSGVTETGQQTKSFGTGVIYSDNGYILTNAHVVDDTTSVIVIDSVGTRHTATIVGMDSDSDVAVVKINATGLTPAEFGQSSSIVPGDKVIAIGTPYDPHLAYTATEGIVSALRDNLSFPRLGYTLDMIQHDAAINSGNSGGPLINEYGQVIGINSIKISGTYENLGFALPIDEVLPLVEEIMNHGYVSRPGIGISGSTNATGGVLIATVIPGGAAEEAGLQVNDIILTVNGTEIETIYHLKDMLNKMEVGESITVTYQRGDQISETTMVLKEISAS